MSTPTGKKHQKQAKSCEKDASRAESASSHSSSFQILLQSRGSSNQSYPDKISMTSKDMKALNVKAGQTWVQMIDFSDSTQIEMKSVLSAISKRTSVLRLYTSCMFAQITFLMYLPFVCSVWIIQ
jgi:phosphatidate phosphatase PAH1